MEAKDKHYLYNMYNATSNDDGRGNDELETYENWLEKQLLSRLKTIDILESQLNEANEKLKQLELEYLKLDLAKSNLDEPLRSFEDFIEVPDIRNKLGSIVTLIQLSEKKQMDLPLFKECINTAKKAVNYLAKREVFTNKTS